MRAVRLKRTKDIGARTRDVKRRRERRERERESERTIGNWLVKSCHVVVVVDLYIYDTKYIYIITNS